MAGKHGSLRHSTTSFSQRVVVAGGGLSNVRSFSILQSGEGSTSFNNDNSANFSGEKKYNEKFRGVYLLIIREKNLKSNLVLVVVLVLEHKGLYSHLNPFTLSRGQYTKIHQKV